MGEEQGLVDQAAVLHVIQQLPDVESVEPGAVNVANCQADRSGEKGFAESSQPLGPIPAAASTGPSADKVNVTVNSHEEVGPKPHAG